MIVYCYYSSSCISLLLVVLVPMGVEQAAHYVAAVARCCGVAGTCFSSGRCRKYQPQASTLCFVCEGDAMVYAAGLPIILVIVPLVDKHR